MISQELRARILRLHHAEQWTCACLARELGLHHSTVRRVLAQAGVEQAMHSPRPSKIDPYVPMILQMLEKHPTLRASRLYAMARERGYDGRPDHFRHFVARLRPRRPSEAFLRLRTLPGEQAQVDWAHFGQLQVGRAVRKLYGFVMVLSWSRWIFLRFGFDIGMAGFLRGHVGAFEAMGGVPRVLLYDNLKSAVLERVGDAIRFHPELLELSGHYRYEPRPVAVARGNEKGRVERAIQYIRHAFFAARKFRDIDDLNAQADAWCRGEAADRRCPDEPGTTVRQAFEHEQKLLRSLPPDAYPTEERKEVAVGKTPYVRFDLNDYSVPHDVTRRQLVVQATTTRVRVLDGQTVLADHARTFDRDRQVEDPMHLQALVDFKHQAHLHRSQDRLLQAVPKAREVLGLLAQRGQNLGSAVAALSRLLDHYGPTELEAAVVEALGQQAPHPSSVRQILEQARRRRGQQPPVSVALPDRVRNLTVRPHALADYDQLTKEPSDA
jgi:transposase/phosphoglycolate phosphatase-like HAD superfamily hydrolase